MSCFLDKTFLLNQINFLSSQTYEDGDEDEDVLSLFDFQSVNILVQYPHVVEMPKCFF